MSALVENPQGPAERWQHQISSLPEAVTRIYNTKEFFDGEIKVMNRTFKIHKMVLAARSPRFENLFLENSAREFELDDVTEDGFDNLLRFIYTEKVNSLDRNQLLETYRAAIAYEQQSLIDKCDAMLADYEITVENVCFLLNDASDIPAVNKHCVEFLQNNTATVLRSDEFTKATTETVLNMFHFGLFTSVTPILLVENILRWAKKQLPDGQEHLIRQQLLETKILGKMGLHKLTTDELVSVTDDYEDLLTDKELKMLFVHTARPTSGKPLPAWCENMPNE